MGSDEYQGIIPQLTVPSTDDAVEFCNPPEDTFWGDRYAQINDPSGGLWSLGTRTDDLSIVEHEARADEWSKEHRR